MHMAGHPGGEGQPNLDSIRLNLTSAGLSEADIGAAQPGRKGEKCRIADSKDEARKQMGNLG